MELHPEVRNILPELQEVDFQRSRACVFRARVALGSQDWGATCKQKQLCVLYALCIAKTKKTPAQFWFTCTCGTKSAAMLHLTTHIWSYLIFFKVQQSQLPPLEMHRSTSSTRRRSVNQLYYFSSWWRREDWNHGNQESSDLELGYTPLNSQQQFHSFQILSMGFWLG